MTDKITKTEYVLDNDEEASRFAKQHDMIKDAMDGLILAPIDLSRSGLRILDSGTADGMLPNPFAHSYQE
jgi:hypothetical protein